MVLAILIPSWAGKVGGGDGFPELGAVCPPGCWRAHWLLPMPGCSVGSQGPHLSWDALAPILVSCEPFPIASCEDR